MKIPFNKVHPQGNEIKYISEAIKSFHISGDGIFTKKCSKYLEKSLGVPKALLTTSCTHALEMSAILMNIEPGDEVIIPSFTFVSTVNAFVLRGAVPVFADIRSDTLNLDESQLENIITEKTKAIVPVHYAGVGCEIHTIIKIAKKYKIFVIEDNAHGLFGKYKGKFLGTFGAFSANSFHETKNFTSGEGGALIINDSEYLERSEIIREKGTNRTAFFRGQIDKYGWVDIGSSYLPSDILAAYLYAQFEKRKEIQLKRKKIWEYYNKNLSSWAKDNNVKLPYVPDHCEQAYHMFYMLLPSLSVRTKFIESMKNKDINCVFHYLPLNDSIMGKKYGWEKGDCPITERVSDRLVRLPFYNDLLPDIDYVVENIINFRCS
jgi:dTDP-4-amino-4,6-dideoxygalactose transaminase